MNKRAELTTEQIVGLIILIVSFAIILFLLFRLNLQELTDKEICHNSILTVGKSTIKSEASIDCKTNYVCISGGKKCENFLPSLTREIQLTDSEEENKNKIMNALAEEMADCWWMFGEGKVNYVGGNILLVDTTCSLCSVIAFDEEIKETMENSVITYGDFYDYLENTSFKNSRSYFYYLYNFYGREELSPEALGVKMEDEIKFKNQYIVLTALSKRPFIRWTGLQTMFTVKIYEKLTNKIIDENRYLYPPVLLEKTEENLKDQGCDSFLTKA